MSAGRIRTNWERLDERFRMLTGGHPFAAHSIGCAAWCIGYVRGLLDAA